MNTSQLKAYAPQARRDFIASVTARAAKYGLTAKAAAPMIEQGDVVLIGDKAFPRAVADQRRKLEERIQQQGFAQVMEAMAYTWFNRCMAIRYMELHGYLDHGRRVLSHPAKAGAFEILEACTEIELPGVNRERVIELKLDGSKDEELYRLLLLGQCHALHQAMPFLFEVIDDETELLLPDNLTRTDSPIRHLVDDIPEEQWQQIEIIGWIYQFYISEKKDQVIGKVVKSEDIPAATQLFTPNWIVKYMVQNSLGAQWLATYPNSPLKGQMEYYIEPAEQTDAVKAQLAAITPSTLNPEELTLIDPASGSGHILVEAYELFKAIYLERGYRQKDIAQMILEKNLFGLEICPRAAQLTGFALMMKGRADDRRLFERGVKLNVMALQSSTGFDAECLSKGGGLSDYALKAGDVTDLKQLFEHATTFGSLIQVPEELAKKLPALRRLSEATSQDLFVSEALKRLRLLVQQAELLAAQYAAVVANPPYMGAKAMNARVKKFATEAFPDSKSDLFAVSAERFLNLVAPTGFVSLMTPFTWMFLKSYESLRCRVLKTQTLRSLIQPQYHTMFESAAVPICTFVVQNYHFPSYCASFIDLTDFYGADRQAGKALEAIADADCGWFHQVKPDEFQMIPGSPIAYWVSDTLRHVFFSSPSVSDVADPRQGLATGKNDEFLRLWNEVDLANVSFDCLSHDDSVTRSERWYPCQKGGPFRRWYGNHQYLVNWQHDGRDLIAFKPNAVIRNAAYYFREGATWSSLSSSTLSMRYHPPGFIFESKGSVCFPHPGSSLDYLIALSNSVVVDACLRALSPTLDYHEGPFGRIPFVITEMSTIEKAATSAIDAAKADWDAYERSWDFQSLPVLTAAIEPTPTLEASYTAWIAQNRDTIAEMKHLEEENNRLFIDAYGLQAELTPEVPIEQITLTVNPAYRYGSNLTEEEQWTRFRQDTMEELVSYAIGCMMGRYSLDEPGLIYAHSSNEGFDPSRYTAFVADDDGIVPITDTDWFDDDAVDRLVEFISVAWDVAHLEGNLTFLADNLGRKKTESSREAIRRYLCDKFFTDHLQTYKKRPIYWLFSSGKQQAFQCLVYLHRYNQGTLARMRTQYVIPLQGLIAGRIEQLAEDIAAAGSTAHRKRLEKERDKLIKQRAELQQFDEKLRHYADQRVDLDLDDGVKVNYGKFGDLLAEVKAVTGTKMD